MITYLKIEPEAQRTWNSKVKLFIKCFFLSFFIRIIGVLITYGAGRLGIKSVSVLMSERTKITDFYSLEISLLLIILVYPILEELAFRGWFSRNKILVSVSLTTLLFHFLYTLIYRWLDGVVPFENIYKNLFIATLLIGGLYFFYIHASQIQKIIVGRYTTLIIISILAFSAIHILNYNPREINVGTILGIAIIILPYPFRAFIYTYIRIKNGLFWSIALHALNNSLILIGVLMGRTDI